MDAATIQAAQAGRREARARLLHELQDPWYRLALSLLGDADEAREATQETALRFLRQLPRFAARSQLKTWATGIALNVIREMRRRQRPLADDAGRTPALVRSPAADAELAEQRRLLRSSLDELPHRQREALLLRFFEEMSVEDTAAAMKCAAGTVKATVHQALGALRRRLTCHNR